MKLSSLIDPESDARYKRNHRINPMVSLCDICGRPLRERRYYVLEDAKTGDLIPIAAPEPEQFCEVYVGSECAKKLKGFVRDSLTP